MVHRNGSTQTKPYGENLYYSGISETTLADMKEDIRVSQNYSQFVCVGNVYVYL